MTRLLPKTAAGRKRALDMALAKNNSITILDRVIKDPLAARLATSKGIQTDKMHVISLAKVAWHTYTKTVDAAFAASKELIASFMKGMFRIVKKVDKDISAVGNYRSEEHTLNSSHLGISYAVFCLK